MENNNEYPENEKNTEAGQNPTQPDNDDTEFENSSVDPGFETTHGLTGKEDKREGNIDANKSISQMREDEGNDALNYKNDRENGAYNPKNI